MKKIFFLAFITVILTMQAGGGFAADTVDYQKPKYRGLALDWCRFFERECGKPAADHFCRINGHKGAGNLVKWNNPGFKTITIGENAVCDPRHHRCDSFKSISCLRKQRTFNAPKFNGYHLDWCKTFASECGKPAAQAFCKQQGYSRVVGYKKRNNAGGETMTIGETSICNPRFHRCDTFVSIQCQ